MKKGASFRRGVWDPLSREKKRGMVSEEDFGVHFHIKKRGMVSEEDFGVHFHIKKGQASEEEFGVHFHM